MAPRLLRLALTRGVLVALPFVAWFVWRAWARRTGRQMGATPWAWLFASGMLLVGLSLMATVVFHADNRGEKYVPAEAQPDGKVTSSRFEPAKK
jgi:type VI protein secretion system component VasK